MAQIQGGILKDYLIEDDYLAPLNKVNIVLSLTFGESLGLANKGMQQFSKN